MNKFWGHLKTITHHRHLVMRGCFRMELIWQGLNARPVQILTYRVFRGCAVLSGQPRAPIQLNARQTAILWRGCTTRAATGTILNTGRT